MTGVKLKAASAILACIVLSGCDTTPSQPQRVLTPQESCLDEARRTAAWCSLGALGSGSRFNDATAQRNVQVCEDRKRMQEDRCYARFKN
jgi:hypothetical protein